MSEVEFKTNFKKLNIPFLLFEIASFFSLLLIALFIILRMYRVAVFISTISLSLFFLFFILFLISYIFDNATKTKRSIKHEISDLQLEKERLSELISNNDKEIHHFNSEVQEFEDDESRKLKNRIDAINSEISSLSNKYSCEISSLLKQLQDSYIRESMIGSKIEDASISGIGRKMKSILMSRGLTNAWVIERNQNLTSIPGIGEKKAGLILLWTRSVRISADRNKPQKIPDVQLNEINKRYSNNKDRLKYRISQEKEKTTLLISNQKEKIDNQIQVIKDQNVTHYQDIDLIENKRRKLEDTIAKYQDINLLKFISKASLGVFNSKGSLTIFLIVSLLCCLPFSQIGAATTSYFLSLPTSTSTSTVTPTFTSTLTPTATKTPTKTSTSTVTDTPTITWTPTITSTATITSTFTPTPTRTPTKTNTPYPTDTRWATPYPGQGAPTVDYSSSSSSNSSSGSSGSSSCHPSYPDVCIPYPPPDLDCGDISYRNFRVVGSDPHRFDGDNDGIGCEN